MKRYYNTNATAGRVLVFLSLLNERSFTAEEIMNLLADIPDYENIGSRELLQKYIATLRTAGFIISKPSLSNNYLYKLQKSPYCMNWDSDMLIALSELEGYVNSLFQKNLKVKFAQFAEKLYKHMDPNTGAAFMSLREKVLSNSEFNRTKYVQYATMIEKIEKYLADGNRIEIDYRIPNSVETEKVCFEPKSIKYRGNSVYVCGYNPCSKEVQSLNFKYIVDVKQLPLMSKYESVVSPVVFKLKGKLAKGYTPYSDEKVAETRMSPSEITVISYSEEREFLFQRLLKYGENCEILYPLAERDKVREKINLALANYAVK